MGFRPYDRNFTKEPTAHNDFKTTKSKVYKVLFNEFKDSLTREELIKLTIEVVETIKEDLK